ISGFAVSVGPPFRGVDIAWLPQIVARDQRHRQRPGSFVGNLVPGRAAEKHRMRAVDAVVACREPFSRPASPRVDHSVDRAGIEPDRGYDVSTLTLEMTTVRVGCWFASPSLPIRSTTSNPCVTLPTIA